MSQKVTYTGNNSEWSQPGRKPHNKCHPVVWNHIFLETVDILRFSGPPWFLTFSIFLRLKMTDVLLRSYLVGSRTEVEKRRKLMSLGLFHGGLAAAVSPDRKQMLGLDHPFMSPLIPGSQFSASQATLWCSSCSCFTYPSISFGLWFIWLARAWMYNCKALHCVARFGCIQDHFISRWSK